MNKFKIIDHPSDLGIIAFGKNHKEVFANAAYGTFALMADLSRVETNEKLTIKISATDPKTLLVNWLNELIYNEDAKKLVFCKFLITKLTNTKLEATVLGEKIDLQKHSFRRPIKAVTLCQLQLAANQAKIIFDV